MNNTTTSVTLKSLNHVALKLGRFSPDRTEAFVIGSVNGDRMTLIFRSLHRQPKPGCTRKTIVKTQDRYVMCERVWSPAHQDFWWAPTRQHVQSY